MAAQTLEAISRTLSSSSAKPLAVLLRSEKTQYGRNSAEAVEKLQDAIDKLRAGVSRLISDAGSSVPSTPTTNGFGTVVTGADPTGVVDSALPIQNTVDAVSAVGGGRVIVPNGTYRHDYEVNMPANVILVGQGEGTAFIRNFTTASGRGWYNFEYPNSSVSQIYFDGQVTTPVGLEYGAGTGGNRFDNDPMNDKLTTDSTIWIHPGADGTLVYQCSIRHTGGYAILIDYRAGDLNQVCVLDNLLENNRPNTFGLTAGAYDYGSWTGNIHYQGDGSGSAFVLQNCIIARNRIYRTTGTGIWGHSYGFDAQATNLVIAENVLRVIGFHGIQFGNVTGGVICGNSLRQGGVITLTDNDTPVPAYLANVYSSGIDMAGFVQNVSITGNSVMNWNGDCFDLDGLRNAVLSGNSCALSEVGEPAYTEDDVANFGLGFGPIVYGMQTGNTSLNGGGVDVAITGNNFRNMTAGAIRLYASKNGAVHGNNIYHPAAALVNPIIIGNVGSTSETRSASNNIFGNTIYWSPVSQSPAIAEDQSLGTFSGTEPNSIWGNRCVGNCYEFLAAATSNSTTGASYPSNSSSLTGRQDFVLQNTGVGVSAAFQGYTVEGTTLRTMFQINDYRDGINRDSVLNVSLDGATSTGIVSTGDWVVFGFGNLMATGWNFNRAAYVGLDYQNAYSDFSDAKADQLTDDYALIRFNKSVPRWEQSITTTAGARDWIPFGGGSGTPGGSNTQIQYNGAGSFAASANNVWGNALQRQTITGLTGTPGLAVLASYVDSAEGFLTASSATSSIQSPNGGVTAKYLIGSVSLTMIGTTTATAGLSAAGQGRLIMNSATNKMMVSENGGAYVDIIGGSVLPFTLDPGNGWVGLNKTPGHVWDALAPFNVTTDDITWEKEAWWISSSYFTYSSGGAGHSPQFKLKRARGTIATPAAVTNGDQMGGFFFSGYDGAAFQQSAAVSAFVDGSVSVGSVPLYLSFQVGTNSSAPELFSMHSDGRMLVNATTDDGSGAKLQVAGFASATTGYYTVSASASAFNAPNGGGTAVSWNSVRNDGGQSFTLTRSAATARAFSMRISASGAFQILDDTSGDAKISIFPSGEVRVSTGDFNVNTGNIQIAATTVINTSGVFVGPAVTATGAVSGSELRVAGNVVINSSGVLANNFGIDVNAGCGATGFNIHGGAAGVSGNWTTVDLKTVTATNGIITSIV